MARAAAEGAAVSPSPLGAYVRGPQGLQFQPNVIALMSVAIPLVSTIAWGIALIVKAARR